MMLVELGILVVAVPVGFLIAWLARDELVDGRIWFKVLIALSVVFGTIYGLIGKGYVSWTCGFILIVCLVSLLKSYDRKWIRIRI